VSRSCVQPDEQLPNNDYLQEFLTFLQQEKGFADATIVNREHSLRPFLAWLVAQDVPLSTVSPVRWCGRRLCGCWKIPACCRRS
jgi:hypothetical protein